MMRRIGPWRWGAVLFLAGQAPAWEAPDPLQDLLDAYAGRAALERVQRVRSVIDVRGDLEGVTTVTRDGAKWRTDTKVPIGTTTVVLTGGAASRLDHYGYAAALHPLDQDKWVEETFLNLWPFSLTTAGLSLASVDLVPVADLTLVKCTVLLRTDPVPITLYLDGTTHRLQRVEATRWGRQKSLTVLSHRLVEGLPVPWAWTITHATMRQTAVRTSLALNPELPADTWTPPPAQPPAITWPKGSPRVKIPAQFRPTGWILTPARLGEEDSPTTLLFDTGAEGSVIHQDALGGLTLDYINVGYAGGVGPGNGGVLRAAKLPPVRLGDVVLNDRLWVTMPSLPVSGVLGYDVFRGLVLDISYVQQDVHLVPSKDYTPPPNALSWDLLLADHVPVVVATLNGAPARLMIDTGGSGGIALVQAWVSGQKWTAKGGGGVISGIGGSQVASSLALTHLKIGNTLFPAQRVDVIAMPDERFDGYTGLNLLSSRCAQVAVDYERKKIFFVPRKQLGLKFKVQDGGLVVESVVPDSPAAAADLQPGDTFLKVGDTAPTSALHLNELLAALPLKAPVTVTIQRGQESLTKSVIPRPLLE